MNSELGLAKTELLFDPPKCGRMLSSFVRLAYISQGKLFHLDDSGKAIEIQSSFAKERFERVEKARQRHAWKGQNSEGFLSGAQLWGNQASTRQDQPPRFLALSRGRDSDQLIYTLAGNGMGGMFANNLRENDERRLVHRSELGPIDVCHHPNQALLTFAQPGEGGVTHLHVRNLDTGRTDEVTEGDSVDRAPAWVPCPSRQIVFQSAGIGRNQAGDAMQLGPSHIAQLDLDKGDIVTLVEDEAFDYLAPRKTAGGDLYYIRRPYEDPTKTNPLTVAQDFILIPFRLVGALFGFLNLFSLMFSGKPLTTAGGKQLPADLRRIVLLGRVINLEKQASRDPLGAHAPLVPKNWQLVRQPPESEPKVIAEAVVSYDLLNDGRVVYTDGSRAVVVWENGKSEELCRHSPMEQIVALP